MELEKGWSKVWTDVQRAGVLPGVDEQIYVQRYKDNAEHVRAFFLGHRGPVLSTESVAEVHRRQFANIAPWAGQWAEQAVIGEHRGSPKHRTALELRLLEDQTRRLLRRIDRTNLDHLTRVAAFLHARFEAIHPFPDGNGRVGRLLTLHFIQTATAAAGIGGPVGLSKGNHPDKLAYVQALIAARETNNLAPLARHYQFELGRSVEALAYLPSPFRIAPKSLPAESYAREMRDSVRETEDIIAVSDLTLRRPWLQDASLDALKPLVPTEATAGRSFQAARKLLTANRPKTLSLGEAVAVIGELREVKPYSLGLLGRDVGAEPFQRWAQERIFEPFLRTLDVPSQAKLRVAIRAQLVGEDRNLHLATDAAFAAVRCAAFVPPTPDYEWVLGTNAKSASNVQAASRHQARGKGRSESLER